MIHRFDIFNYVMIFLVPDHPESVLEEFGLQYKAKVAKWSGIKGSEEIPNVKEMQTVFQSSPALLYCGFERLLATLPAFSVAPLDLSECVVTFLLDLVHTGKSNSRQGALDVKKRYDSLDSVYYVLTLV